MKGNKKCTLSSLLAMLLSGVMAIGSMGIPIYANDFVEIEEEVEEVVDEEDDDYWSNRDLFNGISADIIMSKGNNPYNTEAYVGETITATLDLSLPRGVTLERVIWENERCDPEGAVSFSPSGKTCVMTAMKTGHGLINVSYEVSAVNSRGVRISSTFYCSDVFVVVKPKNLNFVFTKCNTLMTIGDSQEIVIKQQDESGTHDIYYQDYNPEVISSDSSVVEIITEDVGEKWSVYKFTAKAVSTGTATISIHGFEPITFDPNIDDADDGVETPIPRKPKVFQTVTITVNGILPQSVTLSDHSLDMKVGDTTALYADIKPDNVTDKTVAWETSDSSVVQIENGVIAAKKAGTATVTVKTANGKTDKCTVNVSPKGKPVESITLNKSSLEMTLGSTETLTATIKPTDAGDKTVTWTSSDDSVVTVKGGKLTANKTGTATITAKAANGKSAVCKVTVKDSEPTGVTITPSTAEVKIGELLTLKAKVSPDTADQNVTWTSSKTAIASVSRNGVIKGVTVGTVTITAKTANGKTATCKVTVKPVEVTGISLDKTSASAKIGETVSLNVTYSPADATNKSVSWTSSNTSVATVSNGVVTAKSVGTATITAKTSNGKTASFTLTVKPVEVTAVSLNISQKELEQGKTLTLYATVSPSNAAVKTVTWSSSDTSVAAVDANGKVTAKGKGTATITAASNNGKTAVCKITVPEIAVTGITLNKTSVNLNVGDTEALTASITPSNAGSKSVTWSVDNSSVATVDSNGNVKAVGEGKTIVTAKTSNGKTAACTVTVTDTSDYTVQFLPSNRHIQFVEVGETKRLNFEPIPEGITVSFESGKEHIVSVDSQGYITGKQIGSAAIAATVNGKTTVAFIQVTANKEMKYAARRKYAEEVLYYVNIERQKEGLAPVQLMDDLSYLAQIRTDEQVKEYNEHREKYTSVPPIPFISHTRPDGTSWKTVFEYLPNLKPKAKAENLIQWAGISPEGCVQKWMESPGHRANILRANMTHMGIGVVFTNINPEGTSYALCVTQLFIQQGSSK